MAVKRLGVHTIIVLLDDKNRWRMERTANRPIKDKKYSLPPGLRRSYVVTH